MNNSQPQSTTCVYLSAVSSARAKLMPDEMLAGEASFTRPRRARLCIAVVLRHPQICSATLYTTDSVVESQSARSEGVPVSGVTRGVPGVARRSLLPSFLRVPLPRIWMCRSDAPAAAVCATAGPGREIRLRSATFLVRERVSRCVLWTEDSLKACIIIPNVLPIYVTARYKTGDRE